MSNQNNNGRNNNSGTPFIILLIPAIAALIAAILGNSGITGLITSITRSPTPSQISTPTISSSPVLKESGTKIPEGTPTPTRTRIEPIQKNCIGIKQNFYFINLKSNNNSHLYNSASVVTEILNNYPISSSELKPGDAIVAIENNPIYNQETMSQLVNAQTGGRPIRLHVFRPSKYAITPQGQLATFEPPYEEFTLETNVKPCL